MRGEISKPFYGWYGDDFTGATDTLAALSIRGVKSFLFLGPPSERHLDEIGSLQAIGIAGSARAMTSAQMREELEPVGRFFADIGVRVLHYKCCSTFDSAPDIGNIVVAMEVLRGSCSQTQAIVLGGQPSLGRFCAFGNLFASAGSGGEIYRLDRHPTMSRHPSTPMAEADLRRHFQALGAREIALVPWTTFDGREIEVDSEYDILLDALSDDHVIAIGQELKRRARRGSFLIVGASSVAEAVYNDQPIVSRGHPLGSTEGPVLAVTGSLSPLTRRQVEAARAFTCIKADAGRFIDEDAYREHLAGEIAPILRNGRNVLMTTAPEDPFAMIGADARLARMTGCFVDRLLKEVPVRRLIAAGGDTSSHVAQSLGLWGLAYGGQISPGVTISVGRSDDAFRDGMSLMLKGGQMGDEDIFDRFESMG
ncbi:four-carbon acid sugar kinase family protein [Rhizobium sp. LC145]|uniref:four-carbon acid sugar kinase family protein n=1 Tax=Rhizobium sp. LC145 TaxID=1120688 RepID=UPI000629E50C|nr:four-carbon acid sugar kinase family protein [Rhizobium sp. LC145]KKX33317.1 hypothetical protein YH62_07355 [Rhizobium sp. LC145]TKT55801.1 four-carbon acid sugar kinase family protein [Rhizobiaceae bacterium LC148]